MDIPFRYYNRDVPPDIEVTVCISCGYLDAGTFQALLEWLAEDGMFVLGGNYRTGHKSGKEGKEEEERATFVGFGIFFCSWCGSELGPPLKE